jgi:hypothetical protein
MGQKGMMGETGPMGQKGMMGETGPMGQKGMMGETGPMGQKGQKGDTGDKGMMGETGPMGQKGQKGDMGETGNKGAMGEKGLPGDAPTGASDEYISYSFYNFSVPLGKSGYADSTSPQDVNLQRQYMVPPLSQDLNGRTLNKIYIIAQRGGETGGGGGGDNGVLLIRLRFFDQSSGTFKQIKEFSFGNFSFIEEQVTTTFDNLLPTNIPGQLLYFDLEGKHNGTILGVSPDSYILSITFCFGPA